mgnify:CR=1 FL=1
MIQRAILWLKNNRKTLIVLGLTTLFFCVSIWFLYEKYYNTTSSLIYMKNTEASAITELLEEGDSIEQPFQFSGSVTGLVFRMGTYGTTVNGILRVSVYSGDEELCATEKNLSEISDGQDFTVEFKNSIPLKDGGEYTFRCQIEDLADDAKLVFFGSEAEDMNCTFLQNDLNTNLILTFGVLGIAGTIGEIQTLFVIFMVLFWVVMMGLELIVMATKLPIHKLFLIFAVTLGLFYQFVLPPISAPDEDAHATMSFYYSDYLWGKTEAEPITVNKKANKKFSTIAARQVEKDFLVRYHMRPSGEDYLNSLKGIGEKSGSDNTLNSKMKARIIKASPIAYLPQIAGITIARVLELNSVATVYSGRLFSMLAYITLAYWGIKKMPFKKMMLAIVALLPMTIHLAASYSYDSILLGAAFFYTGELFQLAYTKEKIGWRDWACLAVSVVLLSSGKGIYILMMGLCIIIPWQVYGGKLKKIIGLVTLGLASVVASLVSMMGRITYYADALQKTKNYNIEMLWQSPLESLWLFFNTMVNNLGWYIGSMVGQYLGWFEIVVPLPVVLVSIFILIFSAIPCCKEEIKIKVWDRFWTVAVFGAIVVVCFAVALSWNETSALVIDGIQGRYFLPALPLLLLGVSGWNRLRIEHSIDRYLWFGVIGVNMFSLISAFNRIATR